jgi:uncharacterized membrane protein YfcA
MQGEQSSSLAVPLAPPCVFLVLLAGLVFTFNNTTLKVIIGVVFFVSSLRLLAIARSAKPLESKKDSFNVLAWILGFIFCFFFVLGPIFIRLEEYEKTRGTSPR